jgi:hypothetical protein
MRNRILGFFSTLAFLFAGYAVAWLVDRHGVGSITSRPDSFVFALQVLALASIFTVSILFVIVWPQTLLAGWLVRRFRVNRVFPFLLFFAISSIAVCILDFTVIDDERLIAYLVGTSYLFVSCSILWLISFRYEPVA